MQTAASRKLTSEVANERNETQPTAQIDMARKAAKLRAENEQREQQQRHHPRVLTAPTRRSGLAPPPGQRPHRGTDGEDADGEPDRLVPDSRRCGGAWHHRHVDVAPDQRSGRGIPGAGQDPQPQLPQPPQVEDYKNASCGRRCACSMRA